MSEPQPVGERPRMTLNLVVREIMAHANDEHNKLFEEQHRQILRGAASLVAAVCDGMSNDQRVRRARRAVRIINGGKS